MPLDPTVYLQDILDCIDLIQVYTRGMTKHAFFNSQEKQDAAIRRLEIIGEATRQLPKDFTAAHPGIHWARIVAMRNRLIHAYGNVDLELTWVVIEREFPKLKKQVQALVGQQDEQSPELDL